MNLATVMIWPEADFGFVMMTNIAGPAADEALTKLAADLYKRFFQAPVAESLGARSATNMSLTLRL